MIDVENDEYMKERKKFEYFLLIVTFDISSIFQHFENLDKYQLMNMNQLLNEITILNIIY